MAAAAILRMTMPQIASKAKSKKEMMVILLVLSVDGNIYGGKIYTVIRDKNMGSRSKEVALYPKTMMTTCLVYATHVGSDSKSSKPYMITEEGSIPKKN